MKKLLLASAIVSIGFPAFAQEMPSKVTFTGEVEQTSLKDPEKRDHFDIVLGAAEIKTSLNLECQSGASSWGGLVRKDEACSVTGYGDISKNGKSGRRVEYSGGFVIKTDGTTEGETLMANYLAMGKVPASQNNFSGYMMMKPENPSKGAMELLEIGKKKVGAGSGGLVDERIDSVELKGFYIPSAGIPNDKGCSWSGDMVFFYQTESWVINLKASCVLRKDGQDMATVYDFKGNMPWVKSGEAQTRYDLNLTMGDNAGDADADALFAAGDDDLFASVDGIMGSIVMNESNYVPVMVEGVEEMLPVNISITGELVGTNVPVETTRSLGTLLAIMSRTMFGT